MHQRTNFVIAIGNVYNWKKECAMQLLSILLTSEFSPPRTPNVSHRRCITARFEVSFNRRMASETLKQNCHNFCANNNSYKKGIKSIKLCLNYFYDITPLYCKFAADKDLLTRFCATDLWLNHQMILNTEQIF